MRPAAIAQTAAEFGIKLETAFAMRIRYLQSLLDLWCKYIDEQIDIMPESDMMTITGELISIREYQDRLKKGIKQNEITEEMIQVARDYPIENLIELDKGKILCFVHSEKTPSMQLHKVRNRLHCFGCGADIDSIAIMMQRDGMTFPEAVRFLNS